MAKSKEKKSKNYLPYSVVLARATTLDTLLMACQRAVTVSILLNKTFGFFNPAALLLTFQSYRAIQLASYLCKLSTQTAKVLYGLVKVSGCLAKVTQEFHCVFDFSFRPYLSTFHGVVALKLEKVSHVKWHAYLFTTTVRLSEC